MMKLELSLHTIICGRTRKNIRLIESASNTAIYFPPPFPRVYGYTPPGAQRRGEDEVYITGESRENINQAKKKLHELVINTKCYVKEVMVSANKIDSILLDRLDKVRKVMELNGSYVLFPPLGSQRGVIRVQGTEILHVERTVREIMALVRTVGLVDRGRRLTRSRPDSSTARPGGSFSPIRRKPARERHRRRKFGPCSATSAPTREPRLRSRSSISPSTDRTTPSRPPCWSYTKYRS